MATVRTPPEIEYPTSDGRPMAETDDHRDQMLETIETLKLRYARRRVYVSGNLLVFYEEGNPRRHLAPDVFVVRGVSKRNRPHYLIWEERKSPEAVIELTSKSTRREDVQGKFRLYRDVLKVQEYFLFDPHHEYLKPPLRGYRLVDGEYVPIEPVDGRLPSAILGLHLVEVGGVLRLYDPATGQLVPTPTELREQAEAERRLAEAGRQEEAARRQLAEAARQRAEAERQQEEARRQLAEAERLQALAERQQADLARQRTEAENNRLLEELARLRRQLEERGR